MLTQEQKDLIALRIVGDDPAGSITAHRIIEETLRCIGALEDGLNRPLKVYRCCQQHEGLPFTLTVGLARPTVTVCPHCEAADVDGVNPAHSKSEYKRRVAQGDTTVVPPTGAVRVCSIYDAACAEVPAARRCAGCIDGVGGTDGR